MHPELFELKALVAGRLDSHRRREIDDHLGSCADCSRHYVAMMLGSASPKTAEAEAREALVPTGAGAVLTLVAGGANPAPLYGIDAPLSAPSKPAPRAPAQPAKPAMETEFTAAPTRTQVPVSASLVDAITKLRAESEAPKAATVASVVEVVKPEPPVVATVAPAPTKPVAPEIIAPAAESPLIAPSIFTPTPYDGVSVIHPPAPARPQPAPELVVTFSSTPPRTPTQRSSTPNGTSSAAAFTVTTPSPEYVSQAVPTSASVPASEFEFAAPAAPVGTKGRGAMLGGALAAAALLVVVSLAGYKYFQSSVSQAASAAAAAAAKQVEASAARTITPAPAPAPAPVQTRIVYVEKPSTKGEAARTKPETVLVAPTVPIAVTLPEVNLNTGTDAAVQNSTQRNATSELTRSARATAIRTAAPRP